LIDLKKEKIMVKDEKRVECNELIERNEDILSKYFDTVKVILSTNDVRLSCEMGPYKYKFTVQEWQLGYDFFKEFTTHYKEAVVWGWELTNYEALLNSYILTAEVIEKRKEQIIRDQPGIRLTPSTLCNICKHRTSYTTCKAFPSGIPNDLHNKLHTEKLPSQKNDIVFELGEEGSKVTNIKPIKDSSLSHCYYVS